MDNNNNLQNTAPTETVLPNIESKVSNIKIGIGKLTMISLIILIVSTVSIGLAVWGILNSKIWKSGGEALSSVKSSYDNYTSDLSSSSSGADLSQHDSTTFAQKVSTGISVSDDMVKIPAFGVELKLSSDKWTLRQGENFDNPKEQSGVCQLSDYNLYCSVAQIGEKAGDSETLPLTVAVLPNKTQFTSQFSQYKNGSKFDVEGAIEAYEYGTSFSGYSSYHDDWAIIAQITDDFYLFIGLSNEVALFKDDAAITQEISKSYSGAKNKYRMTLEDARALVADLTISKL